MSDVFPHPDHKIFEPTEKNKAFIELIQKIARDDPEAMMEYARSAFAGKGGEELVKQVAESRETINRVKAAFTKIGATLESVDAKKLNISGKPIRTFATAWEEVTKDAQGKEIKVVHPGWRDIAQSFETIMQESQKVAARAAQTAHEFADVLIQTLLDHDTKKKDAHELLAYYKTRVHTEQEGASHIGASLTKLHNDITQFQTMLSSTLDQEGTIKTEIAALEASIKKLDGELEELEKLINGCMWSSVGGGIGVVVGLILCLTPLAPVGIGLLVGGFLTVAGASVAEEPWDRKAAKLRAQKKEHQTSLTNLTTAQTDLIAAKGQLATLSADWTELAKGISVISIIWGTFATGLGEVETSMRSTDDALMKDGEMWQAVYLRQLKLLEAVYVRLGQMLSQWAANVTAVYPSPEFAPPAYKP